MLADIPVRDVSPLLRAAFGIVADRRLFFVRRLRLAGLTSNKGTLVNHRAERICTLYISARLYGMPFG